MKGNNPRKTVGLVIAGLCALLAVPAVIRAEEKAAPNLEALTMESAKTPEQFQALADYFKGEAAEARRNVSKHKAMSNVFIGNKSPNADAGMRAHCSGLVTAYEKAAAEYDAMAAEYEAKAKDTKK